MEQVAIVLIAVGALCTPLYFHSLSRFWRILQSERPDFAERRGSNSLFYTGMPKILDPNVSLVVVGAAFSSTPGELQDSLAMRYARRIRACLLVGVPAYLAGLLILVTGAA